MPRGGRTKREVFRQLPFHCDSFNNILWKWRDRLHGRLIIFCDTLIISPNIGLRLFRELFSLIGMSLARKHCDRTKLRSEQSGTALQTAVFVIRGAFACIFLRIFKSLTLFVNLVLSVFLVATKLILRETARAVCGRQSASAYETRGHGGIRQLFVGTRTRLRAGSGGRSLLQATCNVLDALRGGNQQRILKFLHCVIEIRSGSLRGRLPTQ